MGVSQLPTVATQPIMSDPGKLKILIHGAAGVGKTTFASRFPGALFIATEAGTTHVESSDVSVNSWVEMVDVLKLIRDRAPEYSPDGNGPLRTVVIDTLDNAWKMCRDHMNKKNGIEHEQDLGFGKGSGMILREFERVFDLISKLGLGMVLITHTADLEYTDKRGRSHTKFVSKLPAKPRGYISGLVDVILFASIETGDDSKRRVLRTDADENYEAKDRTGALPPTLPLDFGVFAGCFPTQEPAVSPSVATQEPAPGGQMSAPWSKYDGGELADR